MTAAHATPVSKPPLTVRRLRVDLDSPLPPHWAGDAFRSGFFNALSMSFPVGEQYFIDSMRKGLAALPDEPRAAFADEVQGFIGQEATHRHVHERFNGHLARQGLVNSWQARLLTRRPLLESIDVRNWLAVTAATEHLTAVFAEFMLAHPQALQGAEPRLRDLWLWHSCEETEHRSTAFDLYTALGGDHAWRCRIYKVVVRTFAIDLRARRCATCGMTAVGGACPRGCRALVSCGVATASSRAVPDPGASTCERTSTRSRPTKHPLCAGWPIMRNWRRRCERPPDTAAVLVAPPVATRRRQSALQQVPQQRHQRRVAGFVDGHDAHRDARPAVG